MLPMHFMEVDYQLGEVDVFIANRYPPLAIATLYAQENIGTEKKQTDTKAFSATLHMLKKLSAAREIPLPIYLPYKIGCGYGGGDWEEILSLIQTILPDAILVNKNDGSHLSAETIRLYVFEVCGLVFLRADGSLTPETIKPIRRILKATVNPIGSVNTALHRVASDVQMLCMMIEDGNATHPKLPIDQAKIDAIFTFYRTTSAL